MKRLRRGWVLVVMAGLALVLASWSFAGEADDDRVIVRQKGQMKVVIVDEDGDHREHSFTFDEDTPRPFLGVGTDRAQDGGAMIDNVVEDSAAAKAGLREGDVIVSFDGAAIESPMDLTVKVLESKPGDRVRIDVLRDGKTETLSVEMGERNDLVFAHGGEWMGGLSEGLEGLKLDLHGGNGLFHQARSRPILGVQLIESTPELREHMGAPKDRGVLVGKVLEDTPAADGGVRVGDIIVGIDDAEIGEIGDLVRVLRDKQGQAIELNVIRDGRPASIEVDLPEPERKEPEKLRGPRA